MSQLTPKTFRRPKQRLSEAFQRGEFQCKISLLHRIGVQVPQDQTQLTDLTSPECLDPLTPNNLLTMKSSVVLPPPGSFQRADLYSKKRWRRVQYLVNEFWVKWKTDFLQSLQSRQKWFKPGRNVEVDDVVIIKDEDLPRNQWRLARVAQTHPSDDGLVRKVKLLIADSFLDRNGRKSKPPVYLDRPVQKLVLLVSCEETK